MTGYSVQIVIFVMELVGMVPVDLNNVIIVPEVVNMYQLQEKMLENLHRC